MKLSFQQMILGFAATMALVSFLGDPTRVQAQRVQPVVSTQKQAVSRFVPPVPPDRGAPGRREGGASRGACSLMDIPLTALVPVIKQSSGGSLGGTEETVWGLTVATHPTFWFYVPYSPTSLRSIEFVLQDEQDNDVYRTPVSLPEMPGVLSLRLPSTSKPLDVGRMYHWYFKIYCTQNTSDLVFVEGWVQRVKPNPTLTSQLEAATPQRRIALYATNGFWYDALTSLAELRRIKPMDTTLSDHWHDLLQSAGLADIASKPILKEF